MRRILRPATFVLAAVLVTLAACSSPTAPVPSKVKVAPVVHEVVPADEAQRGYTSTNG